MVGKYGYSAQQETFRQENGYADFQVGRIVLQHRDRYQLLSADGKEYQAEVLGQLRFKAESSRDFPAVGDWVVFQEFDHDQGIIHAILPRTNLLERQATGHEGERQIIAANLDVAFIVMAVDRDFSINRIQRYLAIVRDSNIEPIVVLNKIDLVEEAELEEMISGLNQRLPGVAIVPTSCEESSGLDQLKESLKENKTYCLLGSSGVGKSTLLNHIADNAFMATSATSEFSDRGKHTTTHRELVVLKNGAMIIDNPGMREVGMVSSSAGIHETFDAIVEIARGCKYKDCKHVNEVGCAVLEALQNEEIEQADYENYIRLLKEQEHFESSELERKQKGKALSKHIKNYYKKKNN